jgi:hypothetical protein
MEGKFGGGRIYMAQYLLGSANSIVRHLLGTAICAVKQYAGKQYVGN